jgi:hypothetical protein
MGRIKEEHEMLREIEEGDLEIVIREKKRSYEKRVA